MTSILGKGPDLDGHYILKIRSDEKPADACVNGCIYYKGNETYETDNFALYYILLKHFWPFKWKARRGRTSIFYLIFYVLHCTNFWPFRWKAWRGILFFRGWCWGKFKGFRKRPFLSGLYTSFLLQNFPNHFTLNLRSTKMRTKMKMEG